MTEKKSASKKTPKYLLDTSVQIEKLKEPALARELNLNPNLHSLYFVLYEYKVGFVRSLIDFYLRVEIKGDPADAVIKLSNSFKARELKNHLIMEAIILRLSKTISTARTVQDYLRMVEAAIHHAVMVFDVSVKGMAGSFGSDSIVKFEIGGRSSYRPFMELYLSRKQIMPLEDFWTKHTQELQLLLNKPELYEKKNNPVKKDFTRARTVLLEVQKDVKRSSLQGNNKKLGDSVICVDSPNTYTILSKDEIFVIFCELLSKKLKLI